MKETADKLINAIPSIVSLMREVGVNTIDSVGEILVTEPKLRELIASGYFDGFEKKTDSFDGCEFVRFQIGAVTVKGISVTGDKW